ncbi:hypothetical protein O9H85_10205 [Paenibacillus filicis]|uniref:AB hydrolase-1 domain-containing protein n=1 Tax=Paenibacillus gyeongsangnamensis TaxID=3388067 RepID=A0ABT4Q7C7_9BACL|nr:hypothetical protein [Paenibacillus filicis]MCZ8512780.1 hypothetical protein [Paenibacillus filicis]
MNSIETIRGQGLPVFIDGLIPKLFAPAHLESMPEQVKRAKEIGYGTSPEGAMRTLEAMRARPDRRRVLEEARIPLLLAAGEHDQIIPADKTFTAQGPDVKRHTLKDSGHMSMMEAPEQLSAVIRDFVQGV